jgi:hypothetical protein
VVKLFDGVVTSYDLEDDYYEVRYEDGDDEQYDIDEIMKYIKGEIGGDLNNGDEVVEEERAELLLLNDTGM